VDLFLVLKTPEGTGKTISPCKQWQERWS